MYFFDQVVKDVKSGFTLFWKVNPVSNTHASTTVHCISQDTKLSDPYSWSSMVSRILSLYDLPSIFSLVEYPPSAQMWKEKVTASVNSYWEQRILTLVPSYPSLRFIITDNFKIGKPHLSVHSVLTTPIDCQRFRIQLKLITGTFVLQSNRANSFYNFGDLRCMNFFCRPLEGWQGRQPIF